MIRWITNKLYQRQLHNVKKGNSFTLEKEIKAIYPGEEVRGKWKRHCEEKVKTGVLFSVIGIIIVVLFLLGKKGALLPDGSIQRTAYKEGKRIVNLEATIENEVYPIELTLDEKKLTEDEADNMLQLVCEKLPDVILNKNVDLTEVKSSLNLVTSLPEYPAKIEWESSDENIVSLEGSLGNITALKEPVEVILKANISYEEKEKSLVIPITVHASNQNQYKRILEELTLQVEKSQKENVEAPVYFLPKMWEGKSIEWNEKRKDEVLKEKWMKRNRALLLEYGEFVGKIRLLTGAGLSLTNVLKRMDADYAKRKKEHKEIKYVYEELQFVIRKIDSGVSMKSALQEFGTRCEPPCYKKLVSILLQNQKKGNRGLFLALDHEVKSAFEERKTIAKRLGEEAGTKLLVPMMLLMAMVMIMMIVPAFISFGAI